VFEIISSGGWLMLPIVLCSIAIVGISIERYWTLDPKKIAPKHQLGQVWTWLQNNEMDASKLKALRGSYCSIVGVIGYRYWYD